MLLADDDDDVGACGRDRGSFSMLLQPKRVLVCVCVQDRAGDTGCCCCRWSIAPYKSPAAL